MKNNHQHKQYTRSDIRRYWSGTMPAKEMHDMEAYALDDPFFSDALEGYKNIDKEIAEADLKEIKEYLTNDGRIISSGKNNWLKYLAAASILLLIALGSVYFLNIENRTNDIAVSTVQDKAVKPYMDTNAVLDQLVAQNAVTSPIQKEDNVAVHIPQKRKRLEKEQPVILDADRMSTSGHQPTTAVAPPAALQETMSDEPDSGNETVIVGYGKQKKRDLTGAITQIDGKSESSVAEALAGRASGVAVQPNRRREKPVVLRGITDTSKKEPLIIINGVVASQKDLNALSPKDITSIIVLKAKEATEKYGSKAKNGAMIITTKITEKDTSSAESKP